MGRIFESCNGWIWGEMKTQISSSPTDAPWSDTSAGWKRACGDSCVTVSAEQVFVRSVTEQPNPPTLRHSIVNCLWNVSVLPVKYLPFPSFCLEPPSTPPSFPLDSLVKRWWLFFLNLRARSKSFLALFLDSEQRRVLIVFTPCFVSGLRNTTMGYHWA